MPSTTCINVSWLILSAVVNRNVSMANQKIIIRRNPRTVLLQNSGENYPLNNSNWPIWWIIWFGIETERCLHQNIHRLESNITFVVTVHDKDVVYHPMLLFATKCIHPMVHSSTRMYAIHIAIESLRYWRHHTYDRNLIPLRLKCDLKDSVSA